MDIKAIILPIVELFGQEPGILLLNESNIIGALESLSTSKRAELKSIVELLPPPINHSAFGFWVGRARTKLGLSQVVIASWINLGRDRISKLESGTTKLSQEKAEELKKKIIMALKENNFL